jgi:multidrug resistance efflux pump
MAAKATTETSGEKEDKGRRKRARISPTFDSRPPSFDKRIRAAKGILTLALLTATGVLAALCWAPIEEYYSAPGRVLPRYYREIYAPADGFVEESYVDENDHVTTGQVLVRFRFPDLDLKIMESRIHIKDLQAQLALQQKRNEATSLLALPKDLWGITQEIDKTQSDMAYYKSQISKLEGLVGEGVSSQQELDKIKHSYEQSKIQNEKLKESTKILEEGYRETLLAQSQAEVTLSEERIRGEEERMAFHLSEKERLSTIVAPVDGIILNMHNDGPGEFVRRGDLMAYMTEGKTRSVKIYGGQRNIHLVREGQTVRYKSDIYDPLDFEYAEGHITYVSAIRDHDDLVGGPTGGPGAETYTIYASIDLEPQELMLDSTVQAEVVLRKDRLVKILFGLDDIEKNEAANNDSGR